MYIHWGVAYILEKLDTLLVDETYGHQRWLSAYTLPVCTSDGARPCKLEKIPSVFDLDHKVGLTCSLINGLTEITEYSFVGFRGADLFPLVREYRTTFVRPPQRPLNPGEHAKGDEDFMLRIPYVGSGVFKNGPVLNEKWEELFAAYGMEWDNTKFSKTLGEELEAPPDFRAFADVRSMIQVQAHIDSKNAEEFHLKENKKVLREEYEKFREKYTKDGDEDVHFVVWEIERLWERQEQVTKKKIESKNDWAGESTMFKWPICGGTTIGNVLCSLDTSVYIDGCIYRLVSRVADRRRMEGFHIFLCILRVHNRCCIVICA